MTVKDAISALQKVDQSLPLVNREKYEIKTIFQQEVSIYIEGEKHDASRVVIW